MDKQFKEFKFKHFKWCPGDRYDGWRVRNVDTVFQVIPFFLRTRIDAQNFYSDRIKINHLEQFVADHKEEMPQLSIMHILIAAMVRLFSQRPNLNRFVVWNKIFARNHFNLSIAVKRSLTDDGEETLIKPYFKLGYTLQDVVTHINAEIEKNIKLGQKNGSDVVAKTLGFLPSFLLRTAVLSLFWLDKVGILPRTIFRVSPWHSSLFLTNIGSIGVESIYHHLYEFGTCSMFLALGRKTTHNVTNRDGEIKKEKSLLLRFVLDERVCDGFYYASSMRVLNKILANPECLLVPPEKIVYDEGVRRKPITE
ncbi:MAG: 2-oxo acid dehydrogenase subunit E2 [Prevotellaceae bacterium]|jgi:pyruvate/2-oxoglutarate dehydrogenase complex dihydrolipoamide acyltransferase (E2) component|nr:2-oxo acid dehydrogenase subunit E2 [Prevotellaceae bacterium]